MNIKNLFKKKSQEEILKELDDKIAIQAKELESVKQINQKAKILNNINKEMKEMKSENNIDNGLSKLGKIFNDSMKNYGENMKNKKKLHNPFDTLNEVQDIIEGRNMKPSPIKKIKKGDKHGFF